MCVNSLLLQETPEAHNSVTSAVTQRKCAAEETVDMRQLTMGPHEPASIGLQLLIVGSGGPQCLRRGWADDKIFGVPGAHLFLCS